jgi:hypothetical protein
VLGLPLFAFLFLAGWDMGLLFAQLGNLADHYREADAIRRIAFSQDLQGVFLADLARRAAGARTAVPEAPRNSSACSACFPRRPTMADTPLLQSFNRTLALRLGGVLLTVCLLLWGAWVSREVARPREQIVTVRLSETIARFVDAEARSGPRP